MKNFLKQLEQVNQRIGFAKGFIAALLLFAICFILGQFELVVDAFMYLMN